VNSAPGTYALVFESGSYCTIEVGGLGPVELRPGFYVYIGSALGPGGLKARIERHWRATKRHHWHVDYLGDRLTARSAWYVAANSRQEHDWAMAIAACEGIEPVPRFGASDCRCRSHLFFLAEAPGAGFFEKFAGPGVRCLSSSR